MSRYKITKDKFLNSTASDISLLRQASGVPELPFRELNGERQVEQIRKKWRLFSEPLYNTEARPRQVDSKGD